MGTPRITGYLLAGAACGPFGLGALTASGTKRLAIVDNACLACIGLAAGSEVSLPELRKNARRTVVTIASVAACAWTLTFCAFDAVLASGWSFCGGCQSDTSRRWEVYSERSRWRDRRRVRWR